MAPRRPKPKPVTDIRFLLRAGYALLLAPACGPPFLATAFDSRADLMSALHAENTPEQWRRVTRPYRLALEIRTARDVMRAVETIRRFYPQHAPATERMLYSWLRKNSIPRRPADRHASAAAPDNAQSIC